MPNTPFPQDSTMAGIADLLNGVGGFTASTLKGDETAMDYQFKAQEAGFNAEEAGIGVKQLWNQELFQEGQKSERGAQIEGGEVAAEAAQGLNVRSQASTGITQATSNITGKDVFQLRNNAFMKAFGFNAQEIQDTAESALDKTKANEAGGAGLFSGLASFAGSGLKAAGEMGLNF